MAEHSGTKDKWQVKVFVFEARHLDSYDYQPICGVSIMNTCQYTQVCKSTANPIWNQPILLSLTATADKFLSSTLNVVVYHSRALRSNSIVGQVKIGLGYLYELSDHCIVNRWLSLSDSSSKGANKGFIRMSACILVPGATMVDLSTPYINNADKGSLLALEPPNHNSVQVLCHVYIAEDLPRMDVGIGGIIKEKWKKFFDSKAKPEERRKDLVDAYLQVKLADAELKTRMVKGNEHPVWNEALHMALQVPTFSDKLKFELYDWDQVSADDLIATSHLPLKNICAQGLSGCLPCFGPSYLNFYGSEREYNASNKAAQAMNNGKKLGCAYRGRVLLHISSVPTSKALTEVKPCAPNAVFLQPFTNKKEYRLLAMFMSASISTSISSPAVFEVSIGNYGNSLNSDMTRSSSTTPAQYPISAGNRSWYMPWRSRKPCCMVDCFWEDCEHRIGSSNRILKLSYHIEQAVEEIEMKVSRHCSVDVVTKLIVNTLEMIENKLKELPAHLLSYSNKDVCTFTNLDELTLLRRTSAVELLRGQVTQTLRTASVIEDTIDEIRRIGRDIAQLSADLQMHIPDVIITLLAGEKRLAYCRVPANEVFYTSFKNTAGAYCDLSRTYHLKEPGVDVQSIASVNCRLWLGKKSLHKSWLERQSEDGQLGVFAECYENQIKQSGAWVSKGLPFPPWSDGQGKISLPRENFQLPSKWKWSGDWRISTECCEKPTDNKPSVTEIIYKWQERSGDSWVSATTWYTNVKLEDIRGGPQSVQLPRHWKWKSDWRVDRRLSTDSNGWEYCDDIKCSSFTHLMRNRHKVRRMKMARTRLYQPPDAVSKAEQDVGEGWLYSRSYPQGFHQPQQELDTIKRRLWIRKLTPLERDADLFVFDVNAGEVNSSGRQAHIHRVPPRVYLIFGHCYEYELRAYIHKAQGVRAGDISGLSDVFVRVKIEEHSEQTKTANASVSPCWDETLILSHIQIYGQPTQHMVHEPVHVLVQLFDQDDLNTEEYLGEFTVKPTMKLSASHSNDGSSALTWFPIRYAERQGGQLLAAFELYLRDKRHDLLPPATKGARYVIPRHIKPQSQPVQIEILCWGVRLIPQSSLALGTPAVEFECDGASIRSSYLTKDNKTLNFEQSRLVLDTHLTVDATYMSPLVVRLLQGSSVKKGSQYLATCEIRNLASFFHDQLKSTGAPAVDRDNMKVDVSLPKLNRYGSKSSITFDWWSKFFASSGEYSKCGSYLKAGAPGGLLQVYNTELELVPGFDKLQDLLIPFPLIAGKDIGEESQTTVAHLKGNVCVHRLAEQKSQLCTPKYQFTNLPSSSPVKCVVRLYAVRAIGLQPSDPNGLADPYIQLQMPGLSIDNRKDYVPNCLDPVFGTMFEWPCTLPQMRRLCVGVVDKDIGTADDVIGETVIDLENRLFTRHRARCGLPQFYITNSEVYQWRDSKRPTEILEEYAIDNSMEPPKYYGELGLKLGTILYSIADFEVNHKMASAHFGKTKERLAVHVLNKLALVPEHVETRRLYHPAQPGIEQGKLQMWLDIFPEGDGAAGPPVDISPREPQRYEVRVVIHGTKQVKPSDKAFFGRTANETSDIYMKCWIKGTADVQETDVHYSAHDGEASFNWRFVFSIQYFSTEQSIIVTYKKPFSVDQVKKTLPPILVVQVWDADVVTADDFIGSLEVRLDQIRLPLKQLPYFKARFQHLYEKGEELSLFDCKAVRGYFPVYNNDSESNLPAVTGKVEMTIEVLSEEEAQARPAGKARESPQALPQPVRSSDSFPWYQHPWKAFSIFVRSRRKKCCCCIFLLLLLFMLVLSLLALPRVLLEKLFPPVPKGKD